MHQTNFQNKVCFLWISNTIKVFVGFIFYFFLRVVLHTYHWWFEFPGRTRSFWKPVTRAEARLRFVNFFRAISQRKAPAWYRLWRDRYEIWRGRPGGDSGARRELHFWRQFSTPSNRNTPGSEEVNLPIARLIVELKENPTRKWIRINVSFVRGCNKEAAKGGKIFGGWGRRWGWMYRREQTPAHDRGRPRSLPQPAYGLMHTVNREFVLYRDSPYATTRTLHPPRGALWNHPRISGTIDFFAEF